jgi:hypothetical protein
MYAQVQVSNLSGFAVWLESISHIFTLDGEHEERKLNLNVQEVLETSKTFRTTVSANIQGFVEFERTGAQRPSMIPISCTVRTVVNYWADGVAGKTSTPKYHLEASKEGLQKLELLSSR